MAWPIPITLADTDPSWAGGDALRIRQLARAVTPPAARPTLGLLNIIPGPPPERFEPASTSWSLSPESASRMSQSSTPYAPVCFSSCVVPSPIVAVHIMNRPRRARRRIVVGVTLVIGAAVLGVVAAASSRGSKLLWLTWCWRACGSSADSPRPLHLGGICWRGRNQRPVISGTTIGLVLAASSRWVALIAGRFRPLRG